MILDFVLKHDFFGNNYNVLFLFYMTADLSIETSDQEVVYDDHEPGFVKKQHLEHLGLMQDKYKDADECLEIALGNQGVFMLSSYV